MDYRQVPNIMMKLFEHVLLIQVLLHLHVLLLVQLLRLRLQGHLRRDLSLSLLRGLLAFLFAGGGPGSGRPFSDDGKWDVVCVFEGFDGG